MHLILEEATVGGHAHNLKTYCFVLVATLSHTIQPITPVSLVLLFNKLIAFSLHTLASYFYLTKSLYFFDGDSLLIITLFNMIYMSTKYS